MARLALWFLFFRSAYINKNDVGNAQHYGYSTAYVPGGSFSSGGSGGWASGGGASGGW